MSINRTIRFIAMNIALMLVSLPAFAWPDRPIVIVVPFAAGGATDVIARIMAKHMSQGLGQPIVIGNTVGAGGTVGSSQVARAQPDGYTLLMGSLGPLVASIGLYPHLAYDPRKDFEPIINASFTPMVVSVRKDLPVKDFREFVSYLKASGTKLNYGSGGVGAQSHLACLYLAQLVNANPRHVPYRGSGPALIALLGQEVDFTCDQSVGIVPHLNAGTIKPLVVAGPARVPAMPNVPTAAEQGLPEFQAAGWIALFAPKNTPKEIVDRLNAAGRAAFKDATVRKSLLDLGNEMPSEAEQTPAALRALVDKEIDKWIPVIKRAGVVAE